MTEHKQYQVGKKAIDDEIARLTQKYSTPHNRAYIHDLFTTVVKLYLDGAQEHDLYLATTALKELRHIFRTFAKYRGIRKVVIFGSHCSPSKSREYLAAAKFAKKIVSQGWMVITGGGGGVMEAGNLGAGKDGFAVKIKLPSELEPNPYITRGEKLIFVKYFFTRKLAFIKESDATVLFPGGFGTHDEAFEALTLLSTGKCPPRPIVFVETPGKRYWETWLNFLKKEMLCGGFLSLDAFKLITIVNSVDRAVKEVAGFYRVYHSLKCHRELTVIRLNHKIPEGDLKRLSGKYRDLLISGEITPCGPLPVEVRCKEFLDLPRICLKFNRRNYGRLVELVKELNQSA